MKVLVTGHRGYIGSVVTPMLVEAGFEVLGVDAGFYNECTLVPDRVTVSELREDIRDLEFSQLRGFDAVVHLAALSNDPVGNLNAHWTEDINTRASVRLAEMAKRADISRFLFSSSCIIYGFSSQDTVNEDSPLAPRTAYATSKVETERGISLLADSGFSPIFLRNGTVHGLSPRMRFDTVFNNLVGAAVATGRVTVFSDGTPWRPVVHVEDVGRAFIEALQAPVTVLHNQAINVGADELNHQVRGLAEVVARTVGCEVEYMARPEADQRSYRTDFSKVRRLLPGFRPRWTIEAAAVDMRDAFRRIGLDRRLFFDPRFTRLRWLTKLIDERQVDDELRWAKVKR